MSGNIWAIILIIGQLPVIPAVVLVLRRPGDPRSMLAWILALVFLPYIGITLFALAGQPRLEWHRVLRRRRRRTIESSLALHAEMAGEYFDENSAVDPRLRGLARLARRLAGLPPTSGNSVDIYNDAEETFASILAAIDAARHHIHLEYYILRQDETGAALRDALIKKARAGVECRVLLDFIGSWSPTERFFQPLRDAGGRVEFCLPVVLWRGRWRVNFRNHRKIAIVDGKIGFTGSQNIGNEYCDRRRPSSRWRDTHIRITGPGVHHLQEIFVADWHYTTKEALVTDEYFPEIEASGENIVQVIASGPDQPKGVLHQFLFAAVGAARHSIHVITPYFVPDRSMVLAFQSACYRGVHVRLLLPAQSDHRVVLWAGRSYYQELIEAGVEILEIGDMMLHSKVVIVDEQWAMVGSANMDVRSFSLNFEVTAVLYSEAPVRILEGDFAELCSKATRIHADEITTRSFFESLAIGAARMASPLL
jgi:cardiolipin synthase